MSATFDFERLYQVVRTVGQDVAAKNAASVDSQARFPAETIEGLRAGRVLSAAVPRDFGGSGCSLAELGRLCALLGRHCGSSAMVLAMHWIQVGCLARHSTGNTHLQHYLARLADEQLLLASMTSEVGTFGETRTSICAVHTEGDRFTLRKDATTGSYCAHADAILVTARRNVDAAPGDQVLVMVHRAASELTQVGTWDTLGMRGTCSPGFKLAAQGHIDEILPDTYADISSRTMVPYSHILWAALWCGIAGDAYGKAASYVRSEARKQPGVLPPTAVRLADLSAQLQSVNANWLTMAQEFDRMPLPQDETLTIGWALKMNNLKVSTSQAVPQFVHQALQIVGILGYKNDSPYSLGRQYRDALSGALMISNDRIAAKSASMLLVNKDD